MCVCIRHVQWGRGGADREDGITGRSEERWCEPERESTEQKEVVTALYTLKEKQREREAERERERDFVTNHIFPVKSPHMRERYI